MIPKIIHQYWHDGSPPREYANYSDGWKARHPDWSYLFWSYESVLPLVEEDIDLTDLLHDAEKITPSAPEQLRSDILRYFLLWRIGGVWVDMDIQPQKAIGDLCDNRGWACWEYDGEWINNAVMGFPCASVSMARVLAALKKTIRGHPPTAGNTVKSGPQFLTPILDGSCVVYPSSYFYPYLWNELHRSSETFPSAYGVHRWNHRRSMQKS